MANEEKIKFNIDKEKISDCILQSLLEIETQVTLNTEQVQLMLSMLNKNNPDFDIEEHSKLVKEELRRIKLDIVANIVKRYS